MVALMFGSSLAAIATLKVLYQVSNTNMSLVDVSNSKDVELYLSCYISIAIMLLIITSFNSLDFIVTLFALFSLLHLGAIPASCSFYFHLLSKMPLMILIQLLHIIHLGSAFSNIVGIISSVLTVVASSL
jgi:hypothetical protein